MMHCTSRMPSKANSNITTPLPHTPHTSPPQPTHTQGMLRAPPAPRGNTHVLFDHFWVQKGPLTVDQDLTNSFVVTPSIAHHLRNLARAVQLHKHPILLQVLYCVVWCCVENVEVDICYMQGDACMHATTRPVYGVHTCCYVLFCVFFFFVCVLSFFFSPSPLSFHSAAVSPLIALLTDTLQGPTSSGKTSLVAYLAQKTGHEFVRINNHEHTDIQVDGLFLYLLCLVSVLQCTPCCYIHNGMHISYITHATYSHKKQQPPTYIFNPLIKTGVFGKLHK